MKGQTEYMCTHCGAKMRLSNTAGRPLPGVCPRRPRYSNGMPKPHRWVINRKN